MFYFIQIYPLLFTCAFNAGQPPGTLQFRVQVASEGGGEATHSNLLTIYILILVFDLYIYMFQKKLLLQYFSNTTDARLRLLGPGSVICIKKTSMNFWKSAWDILRPLFLKRKTPVFVTSETCQPEVAECHWPSVSEQRRRVHVRRGWWSYLVVADVELEMMLVNMDEYGSG